MAWQISGLHFVLLFAYVLAKGHSAADINVNGNNVIDDKIVEELLLRKSNGGSDLRQHAKEYLAKHNLELTLAEALRIIAKTTDVTGDKPEFLVEMGKLLDTADLLRKKISACPKGEKDGGSEERKTVEAFLESGGPVRDLRKRLVAVAGSFTCSKQGETAASTPGLDWAFVEEIKRKLRGNPAGLLREFTSYLAGKGYLSKESMPMVTLVGGEMAKNEDVVSFALSFLDTLDYYFSSPSGRRLVALVPRLLAADGETAMEMFAQEADFNQEAFFNLLQNGDVATHLLNSVAKFIITASNWVQSALEDNLKLAVVNGMLISNNFPSINKKKLLKSAVAIVERCLAIFTSVHTEELNLQGETQKLSQEFEKLYFRFDDFHKLTESELVTVISQFLKDNLMEPLRESWMASRQASTTNSDKSSTTNCGQAVLCLYNQNYRGSNHIVRTFVRTMSNFLVYSWTSSYDGFDYDALTRAIEEGARQEEEKEGETKKCEEIYPESKECDVFSQRRQQLKMMNLQYGHNEL